MCKRSCLNWHRNRAGSRIFCWAAAAVLCLYFMVGFSVQVKGQELSVSAQAFALVEAQSGRLLWGRQEQERLPMASTTKIMTALLALESGDLDTPFQAEEEAILVEGSSMGLLPGDTVTMRDVCYGMLLSSGNDSANLAAVKIAGSTEAFAELMNQRAQEIGMENTHFVTPSGLHDEEHYSTAYDMALLAREALQNPDFAQICGQDRAKLCFGNPPYTRWLSNHNRLLNSYEGCIGVKTGFTKSAGRCLVSAAERDGVTLICVTLNAPNDWQDHTKLLDWGFSSLSQTQLCPELAGRTVPVVGSSLDAIGVEAEPVLLPLTAQEQGQVEYQLLLAPFYYSGIKEGEAIGSYRCLAGGVELGRGRLLAAQDAPREQVELGFWEKVKRWVRRRRGAGAIDAPLVLYQ